jgi:hypothetical protein
MSYVAGLVEQRAQRPSKCENAGGPTAVEQAVTCS